MSARVQHKLAFWGTVAGVVLLVDFAKGLAMQKFPSSGLVKFLSYGSWPAGQTSSEQL